jgi:hypothetical protein
LLFAVLSLLPLAWLESRGATKRKSQMAEAVDTEIMLEFGAATDAKGVT